MSWGLLPLTHTCGGPDATARFPCVRLSAFEESDRRPRVKPGRTPGVGCRQRPTGRPGEEPSYGDLKSPLEADILSSESTPVANPEGFRDDAKQLSGGAGDGRRRWRGSGERARPPYSSTTLRNGRVRTITGASLRRVA